MLSIAPPRDDGGPMGYLVLTAEEADRFAAQLQERAERVRGLSAQLAVMRSLTVRSCPHISVAEPAFGAATDQCATAAYEPRPDRILFVSRDSSSGMGQEGDRRRQSPRDEVASGARLDRRREPGAQRYWAPVRRWGACDGQALAGRSRRRGPEGPLRSLAHPSPIYENMSQKA